MLTAKISKVNKCLGLRSREGCFWYLLLSRTTQTTQSTHTLRQQMPCSQLLLCCWRRLPLLSLSSWSHHFIHHNWTVCRHPGKLLRRDLLSWQSSKSGL